MKMNSNNYNEYKQAEELLGKQQADELFENMSDTQRLFDASSQGPTEKCQADILATVEQALKANTPTTWRTFAKVASVAAMLFLAVLFADRLLTSKVPDSEDVADAASTDIMETLSTAVVQAELDEIEMMLLGTGSSSIYNYEESQLATIEREILTLDDDFWKG